MVHVHSPVLIESFHSRQKKSELEFLKAWSYLEIIDLRPHSRYGLLTKDNSSEGGGKGETGLTPHDEVYTVLEDFVIPMSC